MNTNEPRGVTLPSLRLNLNEKTALLSGRDFWTTQDYSSRGVPSVRFADGPSGLRIEAGNGNRSEMENTLPATGFPSLSALACSWDGGLVYAVGTALGEEAASAGVNVLLGPGVNLKRNPLCGRNFEYFSEDEYLAGSLAAQYIQGVQSTGTAACVKHFAVNGREFARTIYSSEVSERALREVYLVPFEMAVTQGGVACVMTAYNKLNDKFCSENKWLISDILRCEWGFDGIVISDWTGTSDRVAGVKAGEDIEMPRCAFSAEQLKNAVLSGNLAEEEIDSCVNRIAAFAQKYSRAAQPPCDMSAHLALARTAAQNCAVLLKNSVLPIRGGSSVAVMGDLCVNPHLQGGGSAKVNFNASDDILSCLRSRFVVTGFARGYQSDGRRNAKLIAEAVKLSKTAEHAVVFVGLSDMDDAEGGDREDMLLPACQTELLSALAAEGVHPIVVLFSGSAVDTSWDESCAAVLYMPLTGAGTGGAVADLLCGSAVPCGKLAQTFPISYEDVPCGAEYAKDPYICRYEEDVLVGYRWYDAAEVAVKYPFGHGLSYTQFEYSRLSATESGVAFRVKNIGFTAGAEVAQVYVYLPDCGVCTPVKKLMGYEKVYLQPGQEQVIFIPLNKNVLRIFDENTHSFAIYGGEYGIGVGASSRDIRLYSVIQINGQSAPSAGAGIAVRERLIAYVMAKDKTASPAPQPVGREVITLHSPLIDLKRANGVTGRLIYRIADWYCTGKKNTALLTFRYIRVRSAMQYAGFYLAQAHGFVDMCNGRFFSGLRKIITGKERRKENKK